MPIQITLTKQQILALKYEIIRDGFQGTIDEFIQSQVANLLTGLVDAMVVNEIKTATSEQMDSVIAIFPALANKITP